MDTIARPDAKLNGTLRLADGRVLGYAEYGAPGGLPFLAFHGTPGSRLMFRIADAAARALGLRLIAPERPGYGLSSFARGRTLASWAADMEQLARHLGIERFGVAGVSGGGPYAVACAALMPERVLALGLVSPVGPLCGPERPERIGLAHSLMFDMLPRTPHVYPALFRAGRLAFLHAPLPLYALLMSRATSSDWKILKRREVRRNLLQGIAEGLRPGVRGALAEMKLFASPWHLPLHQIRAPAILWQGTADRNVPPACAFRLGELIPGCTVHRLEGAGHYWIFDHMREVLQTLRDAAGQTC